MATQDNNRSLASVKSDLSSISMSVCEGNMKGQPSSPIYKGGGTGGGSEMKGPKASKKTGGTSKEY